MTEENSVYVSVASDYDLRNASLGELFATRQALQAECDRREREAKNAAARAVTEYTELLARLGKSTQLELPFGDK